MNWEYNPDILTMKLATEQSNCKMCNEKFNNLYMHLITAWCLSGCLGVDTNVFGYRTWDSNGNGAEMEHLPAHLWEAFQNNTTCHRARLWTLPWPKVVSCPNMSCFFVSEAPENWERFKCNRLKKKIIKLYIAANVQQNHCAEVLLCWNPNQKNNKCLFHSSSHRARTKKKCPPNLMMTSVSISVHLG